MNTEEIDEGCFDGEEKVSVGVTDKTLGRKKVEQSKTRCQISNQMLLTKPKK